MFTPKRPPPIEDSFHPIKALGIASITATYIHCNAILAITSGDMHDYIRSSWHISLSATHTTAKKTHVPTYLSTLLNFHFTTSFFLSSLPSHLSLQDRVPTSNTLHRMTWQNPYLLASTYSSKCFLFCLSTSLPLPTTITMTLAHARPRAI